MNIQLPNPSFPPPFPKPSGAATIAVTLPGAPTAIGAIAMQ